MFMDDVTPKARKPRKDKGQPRASRTSPVGHGAPIDVRVVLRDGSTSAFGCARRTIENGFHVFFYPSETDRYRITRREFAIAEILEIEITEAQQAYDLRPPTQLSAPQAPPPVLDMTPMQSSGPKIHSVRANLRARSGGTIIERLEQSVGPVAISAEELGAALPGTSAVGGIGDHVA
jgi:hypothetical protein